MFRRLRRWVKSRFRKPKVAPVTVDEPIEYNGEKIDVQIHNAIGFTEKELERLKIGVKLLLGVVNSLEFKLVVLSTRFIKTNGMSSSQIYDYFMSGKDIHNKEADNDIDISITLYSSSRNIVGYTYPNTYKTWINRKYFTRYGLSMIASNIYHEYAHNLGFNHPSSGYTRQNVPYAMGDIVGKLAKDVQNGRELTPISVKTSKDA